MDYYQNTIDWVRMRHPHDQEFNPFLLEPFGKRLLSVIGSISKDALIIAEPILDMLGVASEVPWTDDEDDDHRKRLAARAECLRKHHIWDVMCVPVDEILGEIAFDYRTIVNPMHNDDKDYEFVHLIPLLEVVTLITRMMAKIQWSGCFGLDEKGEYLLLCWRYPAAP